MATHPHEKNGCFNKCAENLEKFFKNASRSLSGSDFIGTQHRRRSELKQSISHYAFFLFCERISKILPCRTVSCPVPLYAAWRLSQNRLQLRAARFSHSLTLESLKLCSFSTLTKACGIFSISSKTWVAGLGLE